MLIKRIKATNFKTYLNLDLDLTVRPEQPIVLIGGENGGGKTTLFDAIYHALYGIKIKNAQHFQELLNNGAPPNLQSKIVLEIYFSGRILNEEQEYILSRTYMVNSSNQCVESVKLNLNGTIFQYGTATPYQERKRAEAEVSKIIKANLPQDLSRYFLFDAMQSGNLLMEDQLSRVIRENIENVMGFNKYLQLAQAAEHLTQQATADRLAQEEERKKYLDLVQKRTAKETELKRTKEQLTEAMEYSVENSDTYQSLKSGRDSEQTLKQKAEEIHRQIKHVRDRQKQYSESTETFVRELEQHVALPQLANAFSAEINLLLQKKEESEKQLQRNFSGEVLTELVDELLSFLRGQGIELDQSQRNQLLEYLRRPDQKGEATDEYAFLDRAEVYALGELIKKRNTNPFVLLYAQQQDLNRELEKIPRLQEQQQEYLKQISGQDFNLLQAYEQNEEKIKQLQRKVKELEEEKEVFDKAIHRMDLQINDEPDPRYEALKKLQPFFEKVADTLLRTKKEGIEKQMLQDLNLNLSSYRGAIERVELSENLRDLNFKIYHRHGNEISLSQLNTASKQLVVQCLLKSLHQYGDYEPPVMIDTVMGVLDEKSREIVLEHYFPKLSHQTILLSSTSEIRAGKDVEKIAPFVSKAYTLVRLVEEQCTEVRPGYFGLSLNA